ncbi:hypothetical protein A6M23_19720 [Acidithiobacillus thiooxidans]|uniref:DNA polymerase I n=2 Tax=Acidithiobacillus thiooxidans TaxID=930 RepID=A0A1C2HW09_ACITH|nr:hypothetical protein A6M23_19720 [Acidithiobacillus thiooxidans]OCX80988.1 hypothetical protein A6P08_14920 [Acidithiobacillus thiooxidans]
MVAHDLVSGQWIKLWQDALNKEPPPFDLGADNILYVAFAAQAEWSCFLQLGWPMPVRCLDLYAEFFCLHNGSVNGQLYPSLLAASGHYGISSMGFSLKESMRDLILSGGPWTRAQRANILDYCASDVQATTDLLRIMLPQIAGNPQRLGQALLRGRYTCAVSRMERNGVPIDVVFYRRLQKGWNEIKLKLIAEIDRDFGVFNGATFVSDRFADFLQRAQIPWPRLPSGRLALDDGTFKKQAKAYPMIARLRELRHALAKLHQADFPIGSDGRMRTSLHPFASKTGRNQPSNSRFIFGSARWLRSLIKPAPGRALAYVDWSAQEIAIAAALSGDHAMWEDYISGDPYLAFAKKVGLAPADATCYTHKSERQRAKAIVLGVGYGMSAESIALQAGVHFEEARTLLRQHRETYQAFWQWVTNNQNAGLLGLPLQTTFGWTWHAGPGAEPNPRSLLNWPMQSNGAEMLRLACCELTENDIQVCAPVHDALLVEADIAEIDDVVKRTRTAMDHASELVLGKGRVVRTNIDVVRFPDRYVEEAGNDLWHRITMLLNELPMDDDGVVSK